MGYDSYIASTMENTTATTTTTQQHEKPTTTNAINNDPLELNGYNNGHKVVAYPSVVTASLLLSPTRDDKPRALSTGRVHRRSGRNLVKDVYERLGVERPAPSSDPGGRSAGLRTAAEQQRARSLSRDRMRHKWPPEPIREELNSGTQKPHSRTRVERTAELPAPLSPMQQRAYKARAAAVYRSSSVSRDESTSKGSLSQKNNPTTTKDLMIGNSKSFAEWKKALEKETAISMAEIASPTRNDPRWEPATPRSNNSTNIPKSITTNSFEWKDEKKEESSDFDKISPLSVKERLLAFGGGNDSNHPRSSKNNTNSSIRRPVEKKNAAQSGLGDHPPKIDIYAECNPNSVPEEITKKPSPTGSGLSMRSSSSVQSANNKGTKIAEAFLAAIHTSNIASPHRANNRSHSFAPVSEVVSNDDPGSEVENVSLLSVNSEEQLNNMLSPASTRSRSKSWNRVTAYTTTSSPPSINPPSTVPSSSQQVARQSNNNNTNDVERLVEERVRMRVDELQRHMLDQLQTFLARLEKKMEARVARLERTVQQALQKQSKR